jgi:hypothetical protein
MAHIRPASMMGLGDVPDAPQRQSKSKNKVRAAVQAMQRHKHNTRFRPPQLLDFMDEEVEKEAGYHSPFFPRYQEGLGELFPAFSEGHGDDLYQMGAIAQAPIPVARAPAPTPVAATTETARGATDANAKTSARAPVDVHRM